MTVGSVLLALVSALTAGGLTLLPLVRTESGSSLRPVGVATAVFVAIIIFLLVLRDAA